jgi:hypothetical protein
LTKLIKKTKTSFIFKLLNTEIKEAFKNLDSGGSKYDSSKSKIHAASILLPYSPSHSA